MTVRSVVGGPSRISAWSRRFLGKVSGRINRIETASHSFLARHPSLTLSGQLLAGAICPLGLAIIPEDGGELRCNGVGTSPGIAIARAVVIPPVDLARFQGKKLGDNPAIINEEIAALERAFSACQQKAQGKSFSNEYQTILEKNFAKAIKSIKNDHLDTKLALDAAFGPAITSLTGSSAKHMRETGEWLEQIFKDIIVERYVGRRLRDDEEVETEIREFNRAFDQLLSQPDNWLWKASASLRHILEIYIREGRIDTKLSLDRLAETLLETLEGPEFEKRTARLRDFRKQLIKKRYGIKENIIEDLAREKDDFVLISDDLSPKLTEQLPANVHGFAIEKGGETTHTATCARSLGLPSVANVAGLTKKVAAGSTVIVDGFRGLVIVNPTEATLAGYKKVKERYDTAIRRLADKDRQRPAVALDGAVISLKANIEAGFEVSQAVEAGAIDGIGLFRTEFIALLTETGRERQSLPSEEEQFIIYKEAAEKAKNKKKKVSLPLTIRTIDFEDDKVPSYLPLPQSANPFQPPPRGVYLCLYYIEKATQPNREQYKPFYQFFRQQIRAILRASHYGQLRIMFPLVYDSQEFNRAKQVVEEIKDDLRREKISFDKNISVGTMVETPSAVGDIQALAKEADFLSIGSNDLGKFLLGIERDDPRSALSDWNSKVLTAIQSVIAASGSEGKSVALCGNMAAKPLSALYLIGIGLREISVPASSIEIVKHVIRNITLADCQTLVSQIPAGTSAEEARQIARSFVREKIITEEWNALADFQELILGE